MKYLTISLQSDATDLPLPTKGWKQINPDIVTRELTDDILAALLLVVNFDPDSMKRIMSGNFTEIFCYDYYNCHVLNYIFFNGYNLEELPNVSLD